MMHLSLFVIDPRPASLTRYHFQEPHALYALVVRNAMLNTYCELLKLLPRDGQA